VAVLSKVFIKGAWGYYYCSPLLVIFHQIFELRDLISTFSKKDFIQRDLIAPNLPDSKAKTQNHQKLYGPCLPWQGLLYLDSL
jgi:hypothetical protein